MGAPVKNQRARSFADLNSSIVNGRRQSTAYGEFEGTCLLLTGTFTLPPLTCLYRGNLGVPAGPCVARG